MFRIKVLSEFPSLLQSTRGFARLRADLLAELYIFPLLLYTNLGEFPSIPLPLYLSSPLPSFSCLLALPLRTLRVSLLST